MRTVLSVAPALVALILVACAPVSVAPEAETLADTDGGLPTKPLDGGQEAKDSGLGVKDAGLGDKDGGLGTDDDAGTVVDDSGTVTTDAGTGTDDAGMPGLPDAGESDRCLACAEEKCGLLATACVGSPVCLEEGKCDLVCLEGSGEHFTSAEIAGRDMGGLRALNPHCFASCSKDPHAGQALALAVTCAVALCPKDCLNPLSMCGGRGGGIFGHGL